MPVANKWWRLVGPRQPANIYRRWTYILSDSAPGAHFAVSNLKNASWNSYILLLLLFQKQAFAQNFIVIPASICILLIIARCHFERFMTGLYQRNTLSIYFHMFNMRHNDTNLKQYKAIIYLKPISCYASRSDTLLTDLNFVRVLLAT